MQAKLAVAFCLVLPLAAGCAVELDGEPDTEAGDRFIRQAEIFLAMDGDDGGDCSEAAPCKTFARANELLAPDGSSTITLAIGTYVENIALDHGATIAGSGAWIIADKSIGGPVLEAGDGELVARDLTIVVTQREPIRCGAGGIALESVTTNAPILCDYVDPLAPSAVNRVRLRKVTTSGELMMRNGDLIIERSKLVDSTGGVWLNATSYDITNSLFARNHLGIVFQGALAADAPHRFAHNTVIDNGDPHWTHGTLGVECRDGAPSGFAHNLVWTSWQPNFGVIVSRGCTHTPGSWVWNYASANPDPGLSPDYHLREGSPLIDAGELLDEDGVDLDGQLRRKGTRADIGADEWIP